MSRMKQIEDIANKCADELGLEIVSVEFVNEMGLKILRVIAKKDTFFSIDDSADLNKLIGDELDRLDLIEEEYYLEVSSEGIEKELNSEFDINDSIGKYVCIRLYAKQLGKKEFYGDLEEVTEKEIKIKINSKGTDQTISFARDKIAKIRLAVKF